MTMMMISCSVRITGRSTADEHDDADEEEEDANEFTERIADVESVTSGPFVVSFGVAVGGFVPALFAPNREFERRRHGRKKKKLHER